VSEFKPGAAGTTEAEFRQLLAYLFAQSSTGTAATGVLAGLGVTQQASAGPAVIVGRGAAVVQASLTTGAVPLVNNTDKTLDILTGSPMGSLPRNDLVIFNADSGALEAVIGVPNAAPVDPAVGSNHIKLARVRNAANATTIPAGAIDDLRVYTTLAPALADSGWVNVSIAAGKAGQAGQPPQVRKIGNQVFARWGWANTGLTAGGASVIAGTIPVGFRPARTCYINLVGSTGNQYAMAVIDPSTGNVTIRIATNAMDWYLFPGELSGWMTD
jgi:hypothetical protein